MPDTTTPAAPVTKPGWQTSEFWLSALAGLAIAIIGWVTASGGLVDSLTTSLSSTSPVLAAIIPLAKVAVLTGLAWVAKELATEYQANRSDVKVAQIQANTATQVASALPSGSTAAQVAAALSGLAGK